MRKKFALGFFDSPHESCHSLIKNYQTNRKVFWQSFSYAKKGTRALCMKHSCCALYHSLSLSLSLPNLNKNFSFRKSVKPIKSSHSKEYPLMSLFVDCFCKHSKYTHREGEDREKEREEERKKRGTERSRERMGPNIFHLTNFNWK